MQCKRKVSMDRVAISETVKSDHTFTQAIETINNDKREKTLITHYQFMSTVLDKRLNILNR